MDKRLDELHHWLKTDCGFNHYRLDAMMGDASFRRYFRLSNQDHSYVIMDAPPPLEKCEPFIRIAKTLRDQGLRAPDVFHADAARGFLVLTDFGDQRMLNALNFTNADVLYTQAIDALIQLQRAPSSDASIPFFTANKMQDELFLFQEWFLLRFLEMNLSAEVTVLLQSFFQFLSIEAASQPQVFSHRDFHSANLMVLPNNHLGILDFQDAFIGPLLYDLVSLLRDCYIDWPETFVRHLALSYRDRLTVSVDEDLFLRWFDLMGLQRHLKALLTFSRKYVRDQNSHYLQYMPRTLNYIRAISQRYSECEFFYAFLEHEILPVYERKFALCVP